MRPIGKIILIIAFLLLYLETFSYANQGYGYMGYYGNHSGSSMYSFNNYNTYYTRNLRTGSTFGGRGVGRGPGSGK